MADIQQIHVLLIEDNPGDARIVQELLRTVPSFAAQVVWVDRLTPALERLTNGGIDVILTDLNLPDATGIEIIKRLRAHAPVTPLVVLTGTYEEEGTALEALKIGAQDYLFKDDANQVHRPGGWFLARTLRYAIERKRTDEAIQATNETLKQKIEELEQLNHIMLDREERILELKERVKTLEAQVATRGATA